MSRVILVALLVCISVIPLTALSLTLESFTPVNETMINLAQYIGYGTVITGIYSNPSVNYLYILYTRINVTGVNATSSVLIMSSGGVVGDVNLPNCVPSYLAAIDYQDNVIYVSCPISNLVYEISGNTASIIGSITVSFEPTWVYYDDFTRQLYVVAYGSGKIFQYNTVNSSFKYLEIASTISNLWPPQIIIPNGKLNLLYVIYTTGYVLYLNYTVMQLPKNYCVNCIIVNLNSTPLYAYYDEEHNILFVSTKGGLYALDGSTGRILYNISVSSTWLTANVNESLLYALDNKLVYVYEYTRGMYFEIGVIHLPSAGSSITMIGKKLYAALPSLGIIDEVTFYKSPSGLYPLYLYVNSSYYNITLSGPVNIRLTNLHYNTTVMLPNGIYNLTITTPKGYYIQPASVMFAVHDSTIKIIAPVYTSYKLIFTEEGLASNDTWSVWVYGLTAYGNLFNETQMAPAGEEIVFYLEPGSYRFNVNPVFGYSSIPVSGSVSVSSAGSIVVPINFTLINYPVNINIINMMSGLSVKAMVHGVSIAGTAINENLTIMVPYYTILLPDGEYTLTITDVTYGAYNGVASPTSNNLAFTVWAGARNINLTLNVNYYPLKISETGLINNVKWSLSVSGVFFNGTHYSYATTLISPSDSVTLMLPDGSYTVSSASNFFNGFNNPYSGSTQNVVINGAGVNVTLTFTPVSYTLIVKVNTILGLGQYTVSIVGVQFNGQPYTLKLRSTQALLAIPLLSGDYLIRINGPYYVNSYTKRLIINGLMPAPLSVRLIGLMLPVIIVAAIAVIVVLMLRRLGYI